MMDVYRFVFYPKLKADYNVFEKGYSFPIGKFQFDFGNSMLPLVVFLQSQ